VRLVWGRLITIVTGGARKVVAPALMRLSEVFGANVRRTRRGIGLSQEALAHDAGLAVTYVGQLERGRRNPTLDVVERIAAVLDADPIALLKSDPSRALRATKEQHESD
jgi:transcriptional regulator with XRE-family HTH domain